MIDRKIDQYQDRSRDIFIGRTIDMINRWIKR